MADCRFCNACSSGVEEEDLLLWNIFQPLQGFFNLMIFMHPKVIAAKKFCGVSYPRAFAIAFWAGLTGGDIKKTNIAGNDGKGAENVNAENNTNDHDKPALGGDKIECGNGANDRDVSRVDTWRNVAGEKKVPARKEDYPDEPAARIDEIELGNNDDL